MAKETSGKEAGIGCLAIFALMPLAIYTRAHVLAALWAWFIVPTFGVKALSAATAYGIVLVLSVAHQIPIPRSTKDDYTATSAVANYIGQAILVPLLALAFGYFLRGWM
jgi:hypothetical protein